MTTPHKSREQLGQLLAEKSERLRILELELKKIQKEVLDCRVVRKEIFKLSETKPVLPEWTNLVSNSPSKGPGTPVAVASDWHWGEKINPSEIGNVNKFNMEIAHKRAHAFFEGIITLLKKNMVNPAYKGIVLCLGGDMVSGNIHQELAETNEVQTMPALLDLVGVLVEGIQRLKDEFGRVFIPCVTGNHGRNTKKMQAKERHHTSFDWLIYQFLEKNFQDDKDVTFLISDGTDQLFSVNGHRFLLTHGDTLGKGGDGIIGCIGPIIRGDQKTRARNGQIGQDYDTMILGHYHQLMWLNKAIVNGSLCGYNEFASNVLRAPFEVPRQALFCVHPTKGINFQMPILLEDSKVYKEMSWVAWPE